MAESQLLSVIRMWAAVAWADGVLAEPEAEGLRRLIRTADLTPVEREAASKFLEAAVALPDIALTSMSPEARRGVSPGAARGARAGQGGCRRAPAARRAGRMGPVGGALGRPARRVLPAAGLAQPRAAPRDLAPRLRDEPRELHAARIPPVARGP